MVNLKVQNEYFANLKEANLSLKVKINTHLRFEAKIPSGSKVVAFTRNYTFFLSLKADYTLKAKVKVTSFQTCLRYLDDQ